MHSFMKNASCPLIFLHFCLKFMFRYSLSKSLKGSALVQIMACRKPDNTLLLMSTKKLKLHLITRPQDEALNFHELLFASNYGLCLINSKYSNENTLVLSELCNSSFHSSYFRWVTKDGVTSAVCCDCCSTPVTSLYCWMLVGGVGHNGTWTEEIWVLFQYKECFWMYRDSHYKDEIVMRPSHL